MIRILVAMFLIFSLAEVTKGNAANFDQPYEHEETRELVALVKDATELVRTKGEAAFSDRSGHVFYPFSHAA